MDLSIQTAGPVNAEISFVFVQGPGLDHTYFRPYVDPLADRHRLVFYDQRLNGQSPRMSETPVRFDRMVGDATGVIQHVSSPTRSARGLPLAPQLVPDRRWPAWF